MTNQEAIEAAKTAAQQGDDITDEQYNLLFDEGIIEPSDDSPTMWQWVDPADATPTITPDAEHPPYQAGDRVTVTVQVGAVNVVLCGTVEFEALRVDWSAQELRPTGLVQVRIHGLGTVRVAKDQLAVAP